MKKQVIICLLSFSATCLYAQYRHVQHTPLGNLLDSLKSENSRLNSKNAELQSENAKLQSRSAQLRATNQQLKQEKTELVRERDAMAAENARLNIKRDKLYIRERAYFLNTYAPSLRESIGNLKVRSDMYEKEAPDSPGHVRIRFELGVLNALADELFKKWRNFGLPLDDADMKKINQAQEDARDLMKTFTP